jgi:dTDP-4-dehydrorhamnose 3,5-epimerase
MIFNATPLAGAYLIDPERIEDDRGFFARTWCRDEFERHGLNPRLVQCNVSYNARRGTLRGMHFQARPHEEAKLVRCTRGAIHDVIVDLRDGSPTYRRWFAATLSSENLRMLYIPEGFAHGFQTLADATEVFYQMSESFHPGSARGVRHDDPALRITWPLEVAVISEKDRSYPLLDASPEACR